MRSLERLVLWAEHKLTDAESRAGRLEAKAVAAAQGQFSAEVEALNDVGGHGPHSPAAPPFSCRTVTATGYNCASPGPIAGATVWVRLVNDLGTPTDTVSISTTDSAGHATLCLTTGVRYYISVSKLGFANAVLDGFWPPSNAQLTFNLGQPYNQLCWFGCNTPQRIDMLLTSKFGSVRLADYQNQEIAVFAKVAQTGTGTTVSQDCLSLTPSAAYTITWKLLDGSQVGGNPSNKYVLSAQLYITDCSGTKRPSDTVRNPYARYLVAPSSIVCGPPLIATYDFSAFPEVMARVGSYSVTLDGT